MSVPSCNVGLAANTSQLKETIDSSKKTVEQEINDNDKVKSNSKGVDSNLTESQKYFGYNLFPERRSNEKFEGLLGGGRDNLDKIKCERKVYNCIQKSPLVKLMLSALKSSGCEVDIGRHITCESCEIPVTGGYDPEYNQIVICHNTVKTEGLLQGVLTHELIHMFDFCRADIDFKNLKHLACTEIRAANLTHCSFITAALEGHASPFNIAGRHAECVKDKAVKSMVAVRKISAVEARAIVDSVFDKCYNDLEPIGRRVRRNSSDPDKCYFERRHYGYGA
ncbi:hypothetical protein CHUAL_010828 [Chamberlinius hualienensis]